MPTWQVTWFYEGNQLVNRGRSPLVEWREVWYEEEAASIEFALSQAVRTDRGYLSLRLAFTPEIYRCTHVRVSNATNPRETKTAEVVNGVGQVAREGAAQVNCAVLVDIAAPPLLPVDIWHHRRFLVRGLGTSMIDGNAPRRQSTLWRSFTAFINWLSYAPAPNSNRDVEANRRIGGFVCPYRLRVISAASPDAPLTALTISPSQRDIVATVGSDLGILKGSKVQISGVSFPRGVNKIWTSTTAPAGPPFELHLSRSKVRLAGAWDGNGKARRLQYVLAQPQQYTIIGMRNRQTGGPFGSPAGRRSRG